MVYSTAVNTLSAYLPRTPLLRSSSALLRSFVRLQFRHLVVDMTRTWKNCRGVWLVRINLHLAHGSRSRPRYGTVYVPNRPFWSRGSPEFVVRRFGCPAVTSGVFTDKLPNTRRLTKSQIDQDLEDGRAIQKVLGTGSTVGSAPGGGIPAVLLPPAAMRLSLGPLRNERRPPRLRFANSGGMARGRGSREAGCFPVSVERTVGLSLVVGPVQAHLWRLSRSPSRRY